MREIKFRAWSTQSEPRMIELDPSDPDGATLNELAEDYNWKLMQYTGLQDKNGVDIYEGDIVTADKLICVVEWKGVGWKATWASRRRTDAFSGSRDLNFRKHEVIGNIYENPELMEGKV